MKSGRCVIERYSQVNCRIKSKWRFIATMKTIEELEQILLQLTQPDNAIIQQKEKCAFIPSLILALQHCIKPDENQVIEAMEVLTEEMEEIAVSIIVPHIADIVRFCLEVGSDTTLSDSLRVKALSCITFLIKLKSDSVLKLKLLNPILQTIFPILTAAPPPGEQDPEDEEYDGGHPNYSDNPKHGAAQMIDTMALHMPSDKLFLQLLPLIQACLSSENPYQKAGGLMCLAVLTKGCAEYICSMMLSWMLLTVCQSLSDSNRVVRSAALFALGQFSEHLQPEVSKYCTVLMPLLLGYLTSLNEAKIGSVTKAFYVLENFMENLGSDVEPYLPTLMETMLSALRNAEHLKIKELAVSAIGALANAAKELLVPYFPPVIESLKGFLIATTEEMRPLQNQSLDMLTALIPKISKEDSSPLAEECIQLSLNLTHTIDDTDLRRYTYCLYSAVSTVSPESLIPHLTDITTVMQLALKSNEGITAHLDKDKTFVLFDDDDNGNNAGGKTEEDFLEDDLEKYIHEITGFSVENAYIDEKKKICEALGKIALSTGVAFQPFLESSFQQVFEMRDFPHKDVRRAVLGALGQFCETQHKVWTENRTETNHQALLKLLDVVLPCFVETVRMDRERPVVLDVLKAMNVVIEPCKEEVFRNPSHLKEISNVFRDVLKKKTACQDSSTDEVDDEEQQAKFDDLLQFYAGEGILLVTSSIPGDKFAPYLNDLLLIVMSKSFPQWRVRHRALGALGQFCQAQHKVWTENRTETNHQALLKLLDMVIPCFVETVRMDREQSIVLDVLKAMNAVIKSCKEEVFRNPSHLKEISNVFRDVLKKKTACQDSSTDEVDDEEQQAEFDDLLQFYAGEGILLVTSSIPADKFAPYLNDLLLIRSFPHKDVRRAALGALGQFSQAQHKVWTENRTETNHQALLKLLDMVIPCFVETVRMDREQSIVLDVLKAMNAVIKSCKEEVFRNPSHLKEISNVFRDVLKKKTACQDSSTDEVDDEEQQAELDDLLQFYAEKGILLVTSSVPAETFAPYLNDLLLIVMSKSISSRTCRRFSSAVMIVEIFHNLKMLSGGREVAGQLWNGLLPVLVAGVKDSDAEVRSNSVFGLGCLAQAGGPLAVSDYPMMLSVFSNMLGKESDLRVIDNLCAALCKMIISDMDAVPLEQVVTALVTHLPLKEDQEENQTVFNCLTMLYHLKPVLVVKLMKPIVAASSHVIGHKDVDEETQSTVVSLMKKLAHKHGAEFQAAAASLPAEQQAKLGAAVTSS